MPKVRIVMEYEADCFTLVDDAGDVSPILRSIAVGVVEGVFPSIAGQSFPMRAQAALMEGSRCAACKGGRLPGCDVPSCVGGTIWLPVAVGSSE